MIQQIKTYTDLLKLQYQAQFMEVFLGGIYAGLPINTSTLRSLFVLFISSHILLYGGLYTINDVRDRKEDKADEYKKNRPLPSGRISVIGAISYAILLISAGLIISKIYFGMTLFLLHILLVVLNIFYTFIFRRIPFLELMSESITHPVRVALGIALAGGSIPVHLLIAVYFVVFGMSCARRGILKMGKGSEKRPNMKYYTLKRLKIIQFIILCIVLLLWLSDTDAQHGWYLLCVGTYLIFGIGIYYNQPVKVLFNKIYLK